VVRLVSLSRAILRVFSVTTVALGTPSTIRRSPSNGHAVAEKFVVFVVTALPGAQVIEGFHQLDGLYPLDHLESQLLAAVPWIQAFIWAFKPTDIIDIRRFPPEERAAIDEMIARLRSTNAPGDAKTDVARHREEPKTPPEGSDR
jgi:hypothetical protein